MFQEIPVESWDELVSVLHGADLISPTLGSGKHHRSKYIFRGMVDASWRLRTTIQRLGSPTKIVEAPLLRNFRKYSDPTAFYRDSIWELMSVAQHNGLPTRILDWTVSPFVACHFATEDVRYKNVDAVIWCLDVEAVRSALPTKLEGTLRMEKAWLFDAPMLDKLLPSLESLDDTYPNTDFVVIFEPPSIHARIINQHGLLSVANPGAVCEIMIAPLRPTNLPSG